MRKRAIGAAFSAAMALSACTPAPAEGPVWVDAPPAATAEDNAAKKPVLTIGKAAAKHLSPAIAKEVNDVVRVDTSHSYASGVATKLGFLTSGHVMRDEHDKLLPNCGEITVTTPAAQGTKPRVMDTTKAASVRRDPQNPLETGFWRDLALLKTNNTPKDNIAELDKENTDMAVGDTVTFVNFRPARTQPKDRGANVPPYTERSPLGEAPYDAPAIFTGQVIADPPGDDKQIVVLLGQGTSYGKIPEKVIAGGASGGAIFDAKGVTKALTTGEIDNTLEITEIEQIYNVDVRGEKVSTAQVGFIQPINTNLLGRLNKEAEPYAAPACDPN